MPTDPPGDAEPGGPHAGAKEPGRVLVMAIGLAAAVALGPGLLRGGGNPPPVARFDPIAMQGLQEIRSRNGLLEATLTAAPLIVHIGGASFAGAGYNGQYGGPVLRVQPGDRVILHLRNQMPDVINLHFHGLRITPEGHGDNMHVLVPPDGHFDYDFRVPRTHPPGLFWYHDHAHRAAEPHVIAGLSGAMLVEGFAAGFKNLESSRQQLLVLKDWSRPGCGGALLKGALHCRIISINGRADWQDLLRPGQVELWRISNQGADLALHLAVPGLSFEIIGRDGLPAMRAQPVSIIDILPASRLDVLVRAAAPGTAQVFATHVLTTNAGKLSLDRPIGRVIVAGAPVVPPAPKPVFPRQSDLRLRPVDASRDIVFSETANASLFMIDGRAFDAARIDVRVPFGTIEEWTIHNNSQDFHEFHIHQLGFQVVAINGAAQPFDGYVDDVLIPENGSATVRIPFTDPIMVGHFMYHCHVLLHEDHGMMANIEVYRPGLPRLCRLPE